MLKNKKNSSKIDSLLLTFENIFHIFHFSIHLNKVSGSNTEHILHQLKIFQKWFVWKSLLGEKFNSNF